MPPSMRARCGPQLRSPTGGYLAAAARARASAAELIIGAMIASAPKSSARLTSAALASRALDFGAEAIIAPMINSAADARALAAAAKYPPVGERSWGPHRALMLGGIADQNDYLREANRLTFTFAM